MKQIAIIIFCFVICCTSASVVYADETLHPIEISESERNGQKKVMKTYELSEKETPEQIPRDSYEHLGWQYDLVSVVKNETTDIKTKEENQKLELDSKTKDKDEILKQLPSTIRYEKKDGYTGQLQLNTDSIKVEIAETKKNSYIVTEQRKYPHLSTNDTTLIPKSISVNGLTLTLSSVTWHSNNKTVDFNSVPSSYTATATYTRTAYKTIVTGYNVKAIYSGTVSKIAKGTKLYTAYFVGTKISPEITDALEPEPTVAPIQERSKDFDSKSFVIGALVVVLIVEMYLILSKKSKGA